MSSKLLDSGNYSLLDLPAQFENPLEGISTIDLSNNFEPEKEIETLRNKLKSSSDWDVRNDAIQRVMSLVKSGAFQYPDFDLNELAPGIAECVTDLRSTLVKWGSLCASACAQTLGNKFSNFIDIFLPAFFKQTTHGTAIIAQSCRLAILQIVECVPHRRTVRSILSKANSKSSVHRKIVAESIQIIQINWPSAIYQSSLTNIKSVLSELLSDKSADVRKIARDIESALSSPRTPPPPKKKEILPDSKPRTKSPIPSSKQTSKSKQMKLSSMSTAELATTLVPTAPNNDMPVLLTLQQSAPTTPTKPSSPFTPTTPTKASSSPFTTTTVFTMPTTKSSALNFARNIQDYILDPSNNREEISNAILHIIELTNNDKVWDTALPTVLSEMPDEIKENIADILLSINFDEEFLLKVLETYGFEDIIDSFKRSAHKLRFASTVITKVPNFEFSEDDLNILQQLVKKKHKTSEKDSTIISGFLESKKPSAETIINMIVASIKEGNSYIQHLASLSSFDDIHLHLDPIASLLNSEDDSSSAKIIERTLIFIEDLIECYPLVPLDTLVEPIVSILYDTLPSSPFYYLPPLAERCLLTILKTGVSVNIQKTIIPLLLHGRSEMAIVLQMHLESLQKEELQKYLGFLPGVLISFFTSELVTMRRAVMMSFVQFYNNFPDLLANQISQLPENQRLLIERLANKESLC